MVWQVDFANWSELEAHVRGLLLSTTAASKQEAGYFSNLLFRGQASDEWPLETTLERALPPFSELSEYYRKIAIAKTQVESFTTRRWDEIDYSNVVKRLKSYDALRLELPFYDYLVYLRHHGFPSPLLDWSRSLYVAAFFALQSARSEKRVAIFVYQEHAGHGKFGSSSSPHIFTLGPNVRTHPRHFLQQGEYTLCCQFIDGAWHFKSHEMVFRKGEDTQDHLWKFTLPASEAHAVLDQLEQYNINAYSLLQSEEALLQTLARRLLAQ